MSGPADQLAEFKDITRNLSRLTESLARLGVNEMKREMVGAMRDMMREESVAQLCAQRPGPSAREPPPEYPASDVRREASAPPARAEAGTLRAEARSDARVWPAVERETPSPVGVRRVGDVCPDPNVSCLAQRLVATHYINVGPAMIGSMAAAERIPPFSDEDKGMLLKDWLNDLWIRDNYNWTDEQVARLILECCKQ